jgi:hypothetical protein
MEHWDTDHIERSWTTSMICTRPGRCLAGQNQWKASSSDESGRIAVVLGSVQVIVIVGNISH